MSRTIDLTLTLKKGMRGVDYESAKTLDQDGWNAMTLHLYSHCGTHMDAPPHFGIAGETIDTIAVERFVGPAWLVKLEITEDNQLITIDNLGDMAQKVQPGDSLLIRTGWSDFVSEPKYRDKAPRIDLELAKWCGEKKIKMIGVESPSVADVHDHSELASVHKALFEAKILIIEGLTNLDAITKPKVQLVALPLKIFEGDGAPARVIAIED